MQTLEVFQKNDQVIIFNPYIRRTETNIKITPKMPVPNSLVERQWTTFSNIHQPGYHFQPTLLLLL